MTIAMLALAGFPATAGFFGKLYLIDAAVDNDYAWLGVVIVIGSAISLAYYLRVVAAVWMRSPSEARRAAAAARRRRRAAGRRSPAASQEADADASVDRGRRAHAAPARGRVRRRRLRGWRRSSSGSIPSRCSTSPATPARALDARSVVARGRTSRARRPTGGRARSPTAGQATARVHRRCSPSWRPRCAGAAPAVGAPDDRATRSRAGVRTGICIVAGDVCRASDAAAAGLAPCTLRRPHARRGADRHGRVDALRRGRRLDGHAALGRHAWSITHADERTAGRHGRRRRSRRSPLGLDAGRRAASSTTRSCRRAAGSSRTRRRRRASSSTRIRDDLEPTWRFGDVGTVARAREASRRGARAGDADRRSRRPPGAAARRARSARGLTTYYVRARARRARRRHLAAGRAAPVDGPVDRRRRSSSSRSTPRRPARDRVPARSSAATRGGPGGGDRRAARPARPGEPRGRASRCSRPAAVAADACRELRAPCARIGAQRHRRAHGLRRRRRLGGVSRRASASA